MKQIQFTKGCPNDCPYCYEPTKMEYFEPEIPQGEDIVQILDMNFLANPKAEKHIVNCMKSTTKEFELVCGVDYRLLTQDLVNLLHNARFKKIRWAWDYNFGQQRIHQKICRMFKKAFYTERDLSCFILANWKIPYVDCCNKLDLLKIWGVKVNDCCYDGGYKIAKAKDWTYEQMKSFRKKCRKHNQMIIHNLDPEWR